MEKWEEIFTGIIPQRNYQTQVINVEDKGLVIELINNNTHIVLYFGVILAIRMLDEGIVQTELYSDSEIEKFKPDAFKNVIYKVTGGEFEKQIQNTADGYWEVLNVKHYVIITQNYNIDIITEWEPEINIL